MLLRYIQNEKKRELKRGVGFSSNDTTEQMIVELVELYKKELPGLNRSQLLRILVRNAHKDAGCTSA